MEDSKGKKLWGVVKILNDFRWVLLWLAGLPWGVQVGAVMTPFILLWISILKSLPWPVMMFLGLTFLFLVFVFFTAFFKVENLPETALTMPQETDPEKVLTLELIGHGDNSSDVYLEVLNRGDTVQMTARVRVLSRSYGDGVKKYGYDGIWSGPICSMGGIHFPNPVMDHGQRTAVTIDKGKSHLLRIATILPDEDFGQLTLALVGIEEKLMWDFEPTKNSHIPFFTLNVQLFGKGFVNIISKNYKVGPRTFRGPVEMQEVGA